MTMSIRTMRVPNYMTTGSVAAGVSRAVTRSVALLVIAVVAVLVLPQASANAAPNTVWSPMQKKHANIIAPRHLGMQLATWYGPRFWGNRTGCGRTLRTTTWGIAHRTLPCGQLVWLRYHGRSIAVPVVDRGPYGGASLDLTQRTSTYLRFSGADHVRMAVLKRKIPIASL